MSKIEETDKEIETEIGKVTITLLNTTGADIARVRNILDILFKQGAFNIRKGIVSLRFDENGWLQAIDFKGTKWSHDQEIALRVAGFEQAIVDIVKS